MFSTLSSFLPQLGGTGSTSASNNTPPARDEEPTVTNSIDSDTRPSQVADEQGMLKKKKERTHESFIVVRPPPAKNNHPLNLQVQLVPPSGKEQRSLSSKHSFDSTTETDENGAALSRTQSNRSDVSAYSGNTSVTSFSTVGSTSSSAASPRRMIIPLYNLQAHNVLPNVIVDAGTDAKVARFQKRGLEVVGLAVLEPIEVWLGSSYDSGNMTLQRPSSFVIPNDHTPTSSAVSLASDAPSSHAYDYHPQAMVITSPSPATTPQADRNGPRKFFGKIFNKRKPAESGPSMPSLSTQHSNGNAKTSFTGGRPTPIPLDLTQETPRASKRSSLLATASNLGLGSPTPSNPSSPVPGAHFQQTSTSSTREVEAGSQVLGIQPICNSPHYPPRGRHPKAYVWVVRRWLKGGGDGLLDRLSDRAQGPGVGSQVEVRFEWTRSRTKREKDQRGRERSQAEDRSGSARGKDNVRKGTGSTVGSSKTPSLSSMNTHAQDKPDQKRLYRLSRDVSASVGRARGGEQSVDRDSKRSDSPNPPGSTHTYGTNASTDEASPQSSSRRKRASSKGRRDEEDAEEDDAGNDSDPEDSDTPWTCTLIMRNLSLPQSYPSPASAASSPQVHDLTPPQEVKVKVGAVVPTPHHPKVVALLKVPFPLPDIEIERAVVRKRVVTPAGVARPSPGLYTSPPTTPQTSSFSSPFSKHPSNVAGKPGLILTAEEIKDIVSCTSLWVVVREGFGGVGKERRKGDGWRIRG